MSSETVKYKAHGCDITIEDGQITVREDGEEITAQISDAEWNIRTYIVGQIHSILEEYTPAALYETIKKSTQAEEKA